MCYSVLHAAHQFIAKKSVCGTGFEGTAVMNQETAHSRITETLKWEFFKFINIFKILITCWRNCSKSAQYPAVSLIFKVQFKIIQY